MSKRGFYLNRDRFEAERTQLHPTPTQKTIGELLGVDKSLMNNYVHGRTPIPVDRLERLGVLFNCNWLYLCNRSEYRSEEEKQADLNKQWHESLQEMKNKLVSDLEVTKCFFEVLGYKITEEEDRVLMEKIHDCRSFFETDKNGIYHEKLTKGTEWFISRKGFDKMCRSFQLCTVGILDELISLACFGDKLFLDELDARLRTERDK